MSTKPNALKTAEHILRQHAAGIAVQPDDLERAVQLALLNPARLPAPKRQPKVVPAGVPA